MSLVATVTGVDDEAVEFARTLVADAPTREVDGNPATLGDLLTNLDAELLVIPPEQAGLVDEAPCIVAVAPPTGHPPARIRSIGVVWDGTPAAAHARRWADALAERMHAELRTLAPAPAPGDADVDVVVIGCGGPDRGDVAAQVAARAPAAVVVVPLDVAVPSLP